jgi:hypothetical protein
LGKVDRLMMVMDAGTDDLISSEGGASGKQDSYVARAGLPCAYLPMTNQITERVKNIPADTSSFECGKLEI